MKRYKSTPGSSPDKFVKNISIDFKEFILGNGLRCFLYKDNSNPIVNLSIGYKVGSKDEDKGKSGIAHLFEHMMFQGSENVRKNEHFNYVMKSGGISNAFTMNDATVYFEQMPSSGLEMALWLESDRMNTLDITEENLENQKDVVIEERKQIYDNAPYGSMNHKTFSNVFKNSNYEMPVIGEIDDIRSFTVQEAVNFHNNFYSPDNSVLVVSGDIDYAQAEDLVCRYFAPIEKSNSMIRKVNNILPMSEDIEVTIEDNVRLPVVNIAYQIPGMGSREDYALEFFVEIIANNKSSRLYKKLVYEKKIVKSVKAIKFALEDAGIVVFRAMLYPDSDISLVRNEIISAINEFVNSETTDEEFDKIRNRIEFEHTTKYLKLQNISVETIFNYLYFKDTGIINTEIQKYLSVTKNEVADCVKKYMIDSKKLFLTYISKD